MRADQSMAKVLAGLQSLADPSGLVWGVSQEILGAMVNIPGRGVGYALELLQKAGAISLIIKGQGRQKAMYRINASVPPPEPVREYAPHGIEAVTRHLPNRNYTGTGDMLPTVEISVARVRFLEERA